MKNAIGIGLMSGSSLDGLDLATVRFCADNGISFELLHHATIEYPASWQRRLADAFYLNETELKKTDVEYGQYIGETTAQYIAATNCKPDFVASHGHTIFHRPDKGYTLQIGNGKVIADKCKTIVINDFRSEDVSKGGQGAPLVPIGDKILFADFDSCLNIGGIANISFELNTERIAFDICIANQALNYLANKAGKPYDAEGAIARDGTTDSNLLSRLNSNPFYTAIPPKSLGREFFEGHIKEMIDNYPVGTAMSTFVEHIATQVGKASENIKQGKMLVSGGGAYNKYLIERIEAHCKHEVIVPNNDIIDYKEAIVFALLGYLRLEGVTNVLKSVTGAVSDSCSGTIHIPQQ